MLHVHGPVGLFCDHYPCPHPTHTLNPPLPLPTPPDMDRLTSLKEEDMFSGEVERINFLHKQKPQRTSIGHAGSGSRKLAGYG